MADSDDLHSIAREPNEVVRTERLTHHIQRIRDDQHAMRVMELAQKGELAALEAVQPKRTI